MQKPGEGDVNVCVSLLFLMQSFTQQSCISLLHIICISLSVFSETFGIIVILLLVVSSMVVRSALALTLSFVTLWVHVAVATKSDPLCLFVLISFTGSILELMSKLLTDRSSDLRTVLALFCCFFVFSAMTCSLVRVFFFGS